MFMPVPVKLDDTLQGRVDAFAASHDRSPHSVMHEAVTRYLAQEEARESFRREAMDSLEEYQRTGLHLTLDEIAEWMSDWRSEKPMPECHV